MSEDSETPNVARTREVYALLNRRDFDGVIGMFGADAVWDVSRWGLGTHLGLDAIGRFLEDWFGSLDAYEVQIEQIADLGNGVVSAVVLQSAERAGSLTLQVRSAPVFVWSKGRIARVTLYPDLDDGRVSAEQLAASRAEAATHV